MPRTAQERLASDSIHPRASAPVDRVAPAPGSAFASVRGASQEPGAPTIPFKERYAKCAVCADPAEIEGVQCNGTRQGYCTKHFTVRAQSHATCPKCWKKAVEA